MKNTILKGEMRKNLYGKGNSYLTKIAFPKSMKETFNKIVNHPKNREFKSMASLIRFCCQEKMPEILRRLDE